MQKKKEARQTDAERTEERERKLDEEIEQTFPASDPTAAGEPTSTEPLGRPADRKPAPIRREEVEAARKGKGHAQNDSIKRSS